MDYFDEPIPHEKLSLILNSIGLEVESYEHFQEVRGGLAGLITGEVVKVEKHPNADRLSVTLVNTGGPAPLQIVCGAPNVAAGQKVIVAQVGVTIYPTSGDPITMKNAKIRGVESQGMICAEDEIGLGTDHNGIKVLDASTPIGMAVAELFQPYEDHVISIGLTPNRSDAMSHLGVARDVCNWINHHEGKKIAPIIRSNTEWVSTGKQSPISVELLNTEDCKRYCGVYIEGIEVKESPLWLKQRLKAIGQRPINNMVDITNYILHDTGQPLHAFDADTIAGKKLRIGNLKEGTAFIALDGKERKLRQTDLMICDGDDRPLCIGGVFGGSNSGVTSTTVNIFLESAWFHPVSIRKTSFHHLFRTDAATRFEKGVDIGQTLQVVKRAALLMAELGNGKINTDAVDIYPNPAEQPRVTLSYDYLRRVSGKHYQQVAVEGILSGMQFKLLNNTDSEIEVEVPTYKTDIHIAADLVEEIMRIDGFDNVVIPSTITITPSVADAKDPFALKEKLSRVLTGMGFHEMLNNSITHSAFYNEEEMGRAVKMLNNLSSELDILRLEMLETGLQSVARNLNHRNSDLRLFEFGKTYSKEGKGYIEKDHLALFTCGNSTAKSWSGPEVPADLFYLKGVISALQKQSSISTIEFKEESSSRFAYCLNGYSKGVCVATIGRPSRDRLNRFDIKTDVWYADIHWDAWWQVASANGIRYKEVSKFPSVERDLSFVIGKNVTFSQIEDLVNSLSLPHLKRYQLFDVFQSDKLGKDRQSLAMSFTFQDETRTLKDEEVEAAMGKIIGQLEKNSSAEIRKQ